MAKSQELLGKAGLALRGRQFSESAELFEEAAAALQQEGATVKERGALLGAAEARWQLGEKDVALDCYDRALKNAVDAADQSGEAHVLLGKGFALMSIGDSARAIESLERSAALTESCGHAAQHQFVLELLQQAKNITGSGHSTADVHTQEASGSRSNSMDGQPLLAVSLAEGETIKKTRSGQPPGGYAVKLAFARSMMSKGPVVLVRPLPVPEQLATEHAPEVCEEHAAGNFVMCIQLKSERRQVMKGSPESPACNFSAAVSRAIMSVGLQFEHCDVGHDTELQRAFKEVMAWPSFPMLLVGGQLFGGSDIVLEEQHQGTLREKLETALRERFDGIDISAIFDGGRLHRTENSEQSPPVSCASQHIQRLLRMVSFVALKVRRGGISVSAPEIEVEDDTRGPSADTFLEEYLARGVTGKAAHAAFVAELSASLGGFELPAELLERAPTVRDVATFVEEHCPAQGDCSSTPLSQRQA